MILKDNFSLPPKSSYLLKIKDNKFPILITTCFFIFTSYLAFFQHPIWTEADGIFYLNYGKAILAGDAKNVLIPNGSVGAAILFAYFDSMFNDAFLAVKLVAILSGSGIVFLSFFITRNIFAFKIAIVTQLFFAFSARLFHLSTQALNELLPVFFIMLSLFFITKKQPSVIHYIIIGSVLGISSVFRFQSVFVLICILIFILIRNKHVKKNLYSLTWVCIFFLIAFSPQMIYNYTNHGELLDIHSNHYIGGLYEFQTPEWRDYIQNAFNDGFLSIILYDVDLFLQNYFYNLFYHNPDRLFNFGTIDNISIIPLIPFLGLIPFFAGLIFYLNINFNKLTKLIIAFSLLIPAFVIFLIGSISDHFFFIIISPLFVLTLLNIRNIQTNFLPLLILPFVFLPLMSIVPVYRAYHLLPLFLPIAILSAIFFVDALPKLAFKIKNIRSKNLKFKKNDFRSLKFIIIISILILNVGFTYKLIDASFFGNVSKEIDVNAEFSRLFESRTIPSDTIEFMRISEVLSKQPDIENSYLMVNTPVIPHQTNSNMILTQFKEGLMTDSLNDFISRKNWSAADVFNSDILNIPINKLQEKTPLPDYVVYQPYVQDPDNGWYEQDSSVGKKLTILLTPDHPDIPANFEVIYKSNVTDTIIYKINDFK